MTAARSPFGFAGDGLARDRSQQVHALHQTCRQALIAQRGASKLIPSPALAVQSLARLQRRRRVHARNPQPLPPVPLQRIHVHRFHPGRALALAVLPAPPRRGADADKVGRLEAGAFVLRANKRLHKPGTVAIARREVPGQAAQGQAQHMARQVPTTHPGPDQEPAQTYHPVQMVPTLRRAPADPRIARTQTQRRSRKPQHTQNAMLRSDQIPHLTPGKGRSAVRMLKVQQRIPQLALSDRFYRNQRQAFHPRNLRWDPRCRSRRNFQTTRRRRPCRYSRRRQFDPARPLQNAQRLQAARQLRTTQCVAKAKRFANLPCNPNPARVMPAPHKGAETLRIRTSKRAQNLALNLHARTNTSKMSTCPDALVGTG